MLVLGPEQMRAGLLTPLDDMVEENDIDLSTYVPAIVEPGDEFSCAFEDHLYCLGSYAGSVQMLYNKDLFDAAGIDYPSAYPPMTPDEFVDTACQLTDEANGCGVARRQIQRRTSPWDMFFSDDGRTATTSTAPEAVHQFELLASGYERGCLPDAEHPGPVGAGARTTSRRASSRW